MKFVGALIEAAGTEIRRFRYDNLFNRDRFRYAIALLAIGVFTAIVCFCFERMVRIMDDGLLQQLTGYETPVPGAAHPEDEVEHIKAEIAEWQAAGAPKQDPDYSHVNRWLLFLLPGLGGLMVGLLCMNFEPRFRGDGTEVTVHAVHHHAGRIPVRVTFRKLLASVITATVGSSGQEGPITQTGAGVANAVMRRFSFSPERRRTFVIAGMAAGVGALFRVPLGGALYATEVLYRDNEFESEALLPAFIGAIISYSVFCPLSGEGWGALFIVPELTYHTPLLLLFYLVMSVVLAVAGIAFSLFFKTVKTQFQRLDMFPFWAKPMIGGILLGVMAYHYPFVLGSGYGYLQDVLFNKFTIQFCLLMAGLKIIATCLTLGSGNAGGLFAPSLVIGGLLGGAFGMIGQKFGIIDDPAPVVLVGMAGFFGAVSKTPIATLIMVVEMTFGYGLLVPLMTVTAFTYILIPRGIGICEAQVMNRRDSPAHRGDYIIDVLRNLRVSDIMRPNAVPPKVRLNTTLSELNTLFTRTSYEAIPVMRDEITPEQPGESASKEAAKQSEKQASDTGKGKPAAEQIEGIIFMSDIKEHLLLLELGSLVVAADLVRHDIEPIRLDEDASQALGRLLAENVDELPVIKPNEAGRGEIVGAISRKDIIGTYHRQMTLLSKASNEDQEN